MNTIKYLGSAIINSYYFACNYAVEVLECYCSLCAGLVLIGQKMIALHESRIKEIDPVKTMCFTGHRPDKLGGYDKRTPLKMEIQRQMLNHIMNAYDVGYRNFISGMALGTDTYGAILVLGLQKQYPEMNLITAIPFEGQERMWKEKDQKLFRYIRHFSDKDVIVCDGGYHVSKMQTRNKWMVDNSGAVLAVWDGSKGGTANCVRYAKSQHKILWRINPEHIKNKINE